MSGILRSMLGGLGTGMANVGKEMYADAAATDLVKLRDELEIERAKMVNAWANERLESTQAHEIKRDEYKEGKAGERSKEEIAARLEAARIAARGKPTHMSDGQGGVFEVSGTSADQVKIAGTDEPFKGPKDLTAYEKAQIDFINKRITNLDSERKKAVDVGNQTTIDDIDHRISELAYQKSRLLEPKSRSVIDPMFRNVTDTTPAAGGDGIIDSAIKGEAQGTTEQSLPGLPPGTVDNGDGTFTLPSGKRVKKK